MTLIGNTANALWQVLAVGLLLGAGLPTIFALGLRTLFGGQLGVDENGEAVNAKPTLIRSVVGYACFAIIVAVVLAGIVWIVANGGH